MKVKQHCFLNGNWEGFTSDIQADKCQIVFIFGARKHIENPDIFTYLKQQYPLANLVFSSTAGEIMGDNVYDDSVVATAVQFEKTTVSCVSVNINICGSSFEAGSHLMKKLDRQDLKGVFVLSDGTFVNGSELIEGFNAVNQHIVPVTGGLAGDDTHFEKTIVGIDDNLAVGDIVAIGFYGNDLLIGHSFCGGWDEFGHERTITRSDRNVLQEIDHKNALDLYKDYIGDYTKELPGSALFFPISIKPNGTSQKLVRTILGIDEEQKTMTFAGNMPEGSKVRLMKSSVEKLISASSYAASCSFEKEKIKEPTLAILVSCVGRKLVLQDRVEEEIQAAKTALGENTVLTGFYSYGEISPNQTGSQCELHNQTMTVTTFSEI